MWIGFIGLSGVIGRLYVMLPIIPIFIMSLVLHELSHACMANFLGDPTPRLTGRLTLNPMKHLDLWGTLLFFVCGFGWAKPVQVDASYFRKPDRAMVSVALAGPLCNFLLALTGPILYRLLFSFAYKHGFIEILQFICIQTCSINLVLAVFNLLPIPPLDGSRIIHYLLPAQYKAKYYQFSREYALIIFFLVYMFAGQMISPIVNQISKTIWNFVLKI